MSQLQLTFITFLSHPMSPPQHLPAKSKPRRIYQRKTKPKPPFSITRGSFVLFA